MDDSEDRGLLALDSRLRVAVGVTPAKTPEASITDAIVVDEAAQQGVRQA